MAAVRHFGFLKVRNFNCCSGSEGQYASSCQMLCRSVKPLPRCRYFLFFRMSAAAIVYIFKFQICNGPNGWTASPCRISLKSLKLQLRYGDFAIFQNGVRRHVGFLNYKFLTVGRIVSVELRHHAKFRGDRLNRRRDISILDFSRWRQPPAWIFKILHF